MAIARIGTNQLCMSKTPEGLHNNDLVEELKFYEVNLDNKAESISYLTNLFKSDVNYGLTTMVVPGNHLQCDYTLVYHSVILKNSITIPYNLDNTHEINSALYTYKQDLAKILYVASIQTHENPDL